MPDRLPLILVCDDTPAKRYVLSSWLRRSGYRVVETETVAAAREVLAEAKIDLAVLDVHLPDGSGLDITRALRQDPGHSPTPVVHVSAIAVDTVDKVAGLDGGADAYLVDPIEPEELLSTIRALLRSSGARRDAEEVARRMSHLNRAAVRLNVAATVSRLADAVAAAAAEVFDEPAVAILVDDSGARWSGAAPGGAVDASGSLEPARVGEIIDAAVELPATVPAADPAWRDLLPHSGPDSWRVCWVSAGDVVGAVAVPVSQTQSGDDFILERLSQLTGVAFDNLRTLEREHQTAVLLQRSLLPMALQQPSGLALAARYQASQLHAEVGGDFFDAFEVDGQTYVVMGDVQGHSLEAAVVMAELRYSIRAYAYDGYGPAEIMDRVDAVLVRNQPDLTATACIGAIAPGRRSMVVVSAGHPPMLHVRDRVASPIEARGVLLGLGTTHRERSVGLRPGDRLLLMTDGLVERRAESLDDGLRRVGDALAATRALPPERAADRLLLDYGTSDDDVALMVVDIAPEAATDLAPDLVTVLDG